MIKRIERRAKIESGSAAPPFSSGLPHLPPVPEAMLLRHDGELQGDIGIGEIYAWEPDLPHARELCVVIGLTGPDHLKQMTIEHGRGVAFLAAERGEGVISQRPDGGKALWNDISRFREACMRTRFKPITVDGGKAAADET